MVGCCTRGLHLIRGGWVGDRRGEGSVVGAVCTGFPGEKTPSEGCAGIVVKMGCRTSLASPGVKGSASVLRSLVTVKCTGDVVSVCYGGSAEWCRQGAEGGGGGWATSETEEGRGVMPFDVPVGASTQVVRCSIRERSVAEDLRVKTFRDTGRFFVLSGGSGSRCFLK